MLKSVLPLALCLCASTALAGDLNPPPGPVAPTMLALDEIETSIPINQENTPGDADSLFRITNSGRYHLTGNVLVVLAEGGIEIAGSGIEIDLRGYRVQLGASSTAGVFSSLATATDVTIRNGRFIGGGGTAVDLSQVANARVQSVIVEGAGGDGILTGGSGEVVDCEVSNVDGRGVRVSTGRILRTSVASAGPSLPCFELVCCGTITDCAATGSSGDGFVTDSDVVLRGCVATATRNGFVSGSGSCTYTDCNANFCSQTGFSIAEAGIARSCVARNNFGIGFALATGATASGCVARENTLNGFNGTFNCRVTDCGASGNGGDGFAIGESGMLTDCTADGNGNDGISLFGGAVATRCSSRNNSRHGIRLDESNAVECAVSNNTVNGIDASDGCLIRGNSCQGSVVGIFVAGSDSLIDENLIFGYSSRGVLVTGSNNFIARNASTGGITETFDVASGNFFRAPRVSPDTALPWDNIRRD